MDVLLANPNGFGEWLLVVLTFLVVAAVVAVLVLGARAPARALRDRNDERRRRPRGDR